MHFFRATENIRKSTENPRKIHGKSTEIPRKISEKSGNPRKIHGQIHGKYPENPENHGKSKENPVNECTFFEGRKISGDALADAIKMSQCR
jgi:hypothetical protein